MHSASIISSAESSADFVADFEKLSSQSLAKVNECPVMCHK